MRYTVIIWNNDGQRSERDTDLLHVALMWAKQSRTASNRTVKVGHCGDSIRHWSRTISARRNHWATHSTAECSR